MGQGGGAFGGGRVETSELSGAEAWHAFPAPAKLNLFLHVTGRRADGYHLLQSVFRLIDTHDTLYLSVTDDGRVARENALPGIPEEQDLSVRAAKLLQEEAGCRAGVRIRLEKRLPMGGGLGGGSSDAATVLLALNALWGLGFGRSELQEIGLRLGADVPFFVFGKSALVEGVGEVLTPVALPAAWYVVLVPPVAVPTQKIFTDPELTRNTPPITMAAFFAGAGHNDLEPVACRLYPALSDHLEWLGQYGQARMSGSGSCVFAGFSSREKAASVVAGLPHRMTGWVAQGMDKHPLHHLVKD